MRESRDDGYITDELRNNDVIVHSDNVQCSNILPPLTTDTRSGQVGSTVSSRRSDQSLIRSLALAADDLCRLGHAFSPAELHCEVTSKELSS